MPTPSSGCVAFAAETEQLVEHARKKLERKGVALVIANDVSDTRIGFGSEDNAVVLVDADGEQSLPRMPKRALAQLLVEQIAQRMERADPSGTRNQAASQDAVAKTPTDVGTSG